MNGHANDGVKNIRHIMFKESESFKKSHVKQLICFLWKSNLRITINELNNIQLEFNKLI